jgi:predicted nucleic acid-binding protein
VIVADANTILYALTPGEHTEAARAALESADGVAVPALWRLEVANALAVITRRGLLTREQGSQAFTDALATFSSREHDVAPAAALSVALESNLSAYDAEYVALARELTCTLVTNDRRIIREASDVARPLTGPANRPST